MDLKKLTEHLQDSDLLFPEYSFDEIEALFGTLPADWIKEKSLGNLQSPFFCAVADGGYYVRRVDYAVKQIQLFHNRNEFTPYAKLTPAGDYVFDVSAPGLLWEKCNTFLENQVNKVTLKKAKEAELADSHEAFQGELLDYILRRSFGPMTASERYRTGSPVCAHRVEIQRWLQEELEARREDIVADYDGWLREQFACTAWGLRPGLVQKYLNIVFKYLFCFNQVMGYFSEFEPAWARLHCPVDRVIARALLKKCRASGLAYDEQLLRELAGEVVGGETWSNISFASYEEVQATVERVRQAEGLYSKLAFDILYW